MLADQFLDYAPNRRSGDADLNEPSQAVSQMQLEQVATDCYRVRGRANSVMYFIEVATGVVVIDCFMKADKTAEGLHCYFNQQGHKPIVGIVVTQSRHHRMGGLNPLLDYLAPDIEFVVPASWEEHNDSLDMMDMDDVDLATLYEPTNVVEDSVVEVDIAGTLFEFTANPQPKIKQEITCRVTALGFSTPPEVH